MVTLEMSTFHGIVIQEIHAVLDLFVITISAMQQMLLKRSMDMNLTDVNFESIMQDTNDQLHVVTAEADEEAGVMVATDDQDHVTVDDPDHVNEDDHEVDQQEKAEAVIADHDHVMLLEKNNPVIHQKLVPMKDQAAVVAEIAPDPDHDRDPDKPKTALTSRY